MTALEIIPVPIPQTLEADVDRLFQRTVEQRTIVVTEEYGTDYEVVSATALLPGWQDPYEEHALFLLRADGRDAGRAGYQHTKQEGTRSAMLTVDLARWADSPARRRQAYEALGAIAAEHGRTVLQTWSVHRAVDVADAALIVPPTGFGGVPAAAPVAEVLAADGWTLQQIERVSLFSFAGADADIAERRSRAEEKALPGYRYVHWWGVTPEERVEDLAHLLNRMSTDVPYGGMEYNEETWDADRVRSMDERVLRADVRLTGAIEEVATGRLVGYAELFRALDAPDDSVTHQGDTLVLTEHRGHRLGMLLKTANMQVWHERTPSSPAIQTYNAEENRPMLDVNEAVGFAPIAYVGAWQRETAVG